MNSKNLGLFYTPQIQSDPVKNYAFRKEQYLTGGEGGSN